MSWLASIIGWVASNPEKSAGISLSGFIGLALVLGVPLLTRSCELDGARHTIKTQAAQLQAVKDANDSLSAANRLLKAARELDNRAITEREVQHAKDLEDKKREDAQQQAAMQKPDFAAWAGGELHDDAVRLLWADRAHADNPDRNFSAAAPGGAAAANPGAASADGDGQKANQP
ncbi:hypothetical protein LJC48_01190 [Desulfovibrio sp. OttesenSCG-928-C06]|nr:hypothetical protein [Desulfovibrio sp. OttesenSCG-928-C06]